MTAKQEVQESDFQPWESDHTALVHVLWAYGIKGGEADEFAAKIMQSRWMRAVKAHAKTEEA